MDVKKAIRVISVALLALLLAAAALGLYAYLSILPHEPVGIVDGLRFGSRPQRARSLFGSPTQVDDEREDWATVTYTFDTELDGVPVKVYGVYYRNRALRDISIVAEADSPESAERLLEQWKAKVTAAWQGEEGFRCGDRVALSETAYRQELEVPMGAESMNCELRVDGNRVSVTCTRLF